MTKLTTEQTMLRAKSHKKKGEVDQARLLYKTIIDIFPNNKRAQQALAALEQPKPVGSDKGANPPQDQLEALVALYNKGQLNAAVEVAQLLLADFPASFSVWNILGAANLGLGRTPEAEVGFKKAAQFNPNYADAHNNLGTVLQEQGKLGEAIEAYRRALKIKPDYTEAHNNLGNIFKEQGNLDEAIGAYKHALKLKPDYSEALYNMGNALRELGELDQAIEAYERTLKIKPDYAEAHNNMGNALKDQGKLGAAIEAYNRASNIKPDFADAHFNLGLAHLTQYDFIKGFHLFEWRWKTKQNISAQLLWSKPKWDGQKGKRVLLWAEQGIGDEIMFASLIPELNSICSKLIVQCDERLIPLFKRSFSSDIIYQSRQNLIQDTEYDFQISNASLPNIFRTSIDSFKKTAGAYLKCQDYRSDELRNLILKNGAKRIIGISWHSASVIDGARHRNIVLEQLAGHLCDNETEIVSLQYGDVSEQISVLKQSSGMNVTEIKDIDNRNDTDGLAALIMACDQVVSIDNMTVHLAGALGVDTKVLLPFGPDWRWGVKQARSYWYRTLQLYHPHRPNEWGEVLVELQKDLQN